MTAAWFRKYQDVAAVEHDDFQPKPGGGVRYGTVTAAGNVTAEVRFAGGETLPFWQGSGWRDDYRWRLVPVCHRCGSPVLGEPVTDEDGREFCRDECRDEAGQAWHEQHYRAR